MSQTNECNIFTELLELVQYEDGEFEWKELLRWIKYEEVVEEEGDRWSKPHVPTISLRGLLYLRKLLRKGNVFLDLPTSRGTLDEIGNILIEKLSIDRSFKWLLMKKHRHQFEGSRKIKTTFGGVIKQLLVQKLERTTGVGGNFFASNINRRGSLGQSSSISKTSSNSHLNCSDDLRKGDNTKSLELLEKSGSLEEDAYSNGGRVDIPDGKINTNLMKKLPLNSEAAIILAGKHRLATQENPISIFVRLKDPVILNDLPEVDISTRFIYIVILSPDSNVNPVDVGSSLGSAFCDPTFRDEVLKADNVDELMNALDEFADGIKALPRTWDSKRYIEPPPIIPEPELNNIEDDIDEDRRAREKSGLVRTKKLFGGLLGDIKRKRSWYLSDFKDALHPQCISSILFMYFAILAPIVAFGALLGDATASRIATIESLVSGLIVGVGFGLFSGQPLVLLGSTGPVYAFEKILFSLCADQNWDYLSLRLWIGIWIGIFLLLLVAFDASALVCYITRFTEEIFATLIAFIFIFNSFNNLAQINSEFDFNPGGINSTCISNNSETVDISCMDTDFKANVFLMSAILFIGAFSISYGLKLMRSSGFFPAWFRVLLSDFAVIIAIFLMTGLDYLVGVRTPKLTVPGEFKPTWEGRDWVVAHALILSDHALANPWWVDVFLAPVLALLATILIFMDQQITAVIINRKDNKLRKGCGYHLDLFVLAFLIVILSLFGLPWFVAATVESRNHLMSLTKESKESAPGEKPVFLGIREQRVTTIMIGVLIGLSIFLTPILAFIPMPILYGVFLFMGVRSLAGLQFFERLLLIFIPQKHQPDYVFLKLVPLKRVHLFTGIQLVSLVSLWVIKSFPKTSIAFPVMLVVICFVRFLCGCIFSRKELRALDDLLPGKASIKRGAGRLNKINRDFEEEDDLIKETSKSKNRKTPLNDELDDVQSVAWATFNESPRRTPYKKELTPRHQRICFARINTEEPFTAVTSTSTKLNVESLILAFKSTFEKLKNANILTVWKIGLNQFNLIIDNSVLEEYIHPHEAYTIEIRSPEPNKKALVLVLENLKTTAE